MKDLMNQPLPANTFRTCLSRQGETYLVTYSLNGQLNELRIERKLGEQLDYFAVRMKEELASQIADGIVSEAFEQVWRG